MQTIADIMTRDVITVKRETTVRELAEILNSHNFGSLPVLDNSGKITAMVSASDLVEQGRSLHIPTVISLFDWVIPLGGERAKERDLHRITAQTVGEICSDEVVTLESTDPVSKAADTMSEQKLHSIPIVDNGKLVGIVARIDIIRTMLK